jgi:hypothetical protein
MSASIPIFSRQQIVRFSSGVPFVTLRWRGGFARIALLVLALVSTPAVSAQPRVLSLLSNGPPSNRLNLVVLSEGYTIDQFERFRQDADEVVCALLARPPFNEHRSFFNASAIFVASPQAGADHPANGIFRQTYFNSSFDSSADFLITIPPDAFNPDYQQGQGKVDALLQTFAPHCQLPILLVNDPNLGGSDGGSHTAITARGFSVVAAVDILGHEAGHVLASLGDEYTNANPGYADIEEPNTTRESRLDNIKWKAWIDPTTPVPTPASVDCSSVVGAFEGAHYHATAWYRPKLNCAMRSVGAPFCEVCQEALVLSLHRWVWPVDAFSPAATNLLVTSTAPLTFAVTTLQPAAHQPSIRWQVDAKDLSGATNATLQCQPQALGNGLHSVTVTVHDDTPLVRNDPEQRLVQTILWIVTVNLPELTLDSPLLLPGDRFVLRVSGRAPNGLVLQASTNLVDWVGLSTNTLPPGGLWWTNSSGESSARRFYRAQAW